MADYFHERVMQYGIPELRVPAVVTLQTDEVAVARAPATLRELMETLHIVPRISQMPQGTSRPGSSDVRVGSRETQLNERIASLSPDTKPDSSLIEKVKPVQPISCYTCVIPP